MTQKSLIGEVILTVFCYCYQLTFFRFECSEADVNNADVVVPIGGDGTFLSAASNVLNNKKPVIGFNSDPNRSEGHLCIPKQYSQNVKAAVEKLQKVT